MANQQQSIASHKDQQIPQSKPTIPLIPTRPTNQQPSSSLKQRLISFLRPPFGTNHHPHPTSTTQKRHPICRGSHPAHDHRFLNQNPPMELTVPYKPNPLLFSSASLTHNSQTLILHKLPKNPRSKNSHHRPNFHVLASANPNGFDGFSWLSLTRLVRRGLEWLWLKLSESGKKETG